MHKDHIALVDILLVELHILDLLRKFVLYTWHRKVCVYATSSVFKIMI